MPIHPDIASKFHLLEGISSFEQGLSDPVLRQRMDEFMSISGAPAPPDADVRSAAAPGPHGPVPVRVYTPVQGRRADPARPCLVWLVGGAFVGGDLDMPEADWVARQIVDRAGAVVVSVDYRLATQGVTYPVPHDDAVAAIRWVRDSADPLGVDRDRIAVGGASAGGNLAAGATLRLRDDDKWLPATLVLAYTTAHATLPPASSSLTELMTDVPRLLRFLPADRQFITCNYLGGPESKADGYAMPANAILEGLCPVVMLNAEYDDLRVSSEHFAAQLAVAGVDVRQVMYRGMLHGFLNVPATFEPVNRALQLMADVVTAPGVAEPAVVG